MIKGDLQKAITIASESGMAAVAHDAFECTKEGWKPRPGCLTAYYSSGEAILCATLLCFYFELYGRCPQVVVPRERDFTNSVTDLIWPGAWYIYSAAGILSDRTSWDVIKMLLPGSADLRPLG